LFDVWGTLLKQVRQNVVITNK